MVVPRSSSSCRCVLMVMSRYGRRSLMSWGRCLRRSTMPIVQRSRQGVTCTCSTTASRHVVVEGAARCWNGCGGGGCCCCCFSTSCCRRGFGSSSSVLLTSCSCFTRSRTGGSGGRRRLLLLLLLQRLRPTRNWCWGGIRFQSQRRCPRRQRTGAKHARISSQRIQTTEEQTPAHVLMVFVAQTGRERIATGWWTTVGVRRWSHRARMTGGNLFWS